MTTKRLSLAVSAILMAILACNAPTATGSNVQDLAATITSQALTLSAPTSTPAATATITPTFTPSVPEVGVTSATNCRTGPGTVYDLVFTMNPGQTAEIVGKDTAANYWVIKNPAGGTCWLWGQYAVLSGNYGAVGEVVPPPTPTPSAPAAAKNFKGSASCTAGKTLLTVNVHVSLTWTDVASNEDGYRIFRDGSLIVTLAPNSTSFEEDTSHLLLLLIGTPSAPWSVTYGIEAFNSAGTSNRKEVTLGCS